MRCAGAHHHCRPRRCVDSNHLRGTRCTGAHHHPRLPPRERSVCQVAYVSQHTLPTGAQQSGRRETRVRRRYVTDSYGWCADAHHHLRPRRCMNSNPQLVMRCAGAHHHCRPRRCLDSNHLRVTRCAGAHHHPRPPPRERSVCQVAYVSQHTSRAGAQQSGQPPHGKEACVKMRAYHNTHYVPVHNKAVNPPTGKKRVSRRARITIHITCRCTA